MSFRRVLPLKKQPAESADRDAAGVVENHRSRGVDSRQQCSDNSDSKRSTNNSFAIQQTSSSLRTTSDPTDAIEHSLRSTLRLTDIEEDEQQNFTISFRSLSCRDCNLIFVLPLFYYVGISQPFIYMMVQLETVYELDAAYSGLVMASFYGARLITLLGNIYAPKTSHLLGAIVALLGFVLLLVFSDTTSVVLFSLSNIAVGFIEASAVVFVYSKRVYSRNMDKMRMAMSFQSAAIGVGVIMGFFFGGIASNGMGVKGNALVGVVFGGLNLASLICFLVAPPEEDPVEDGKQVSHRDLVVLDVSSRNELGNAEAEPAPFRGERMTQEAQSNNQQSLKQLSKSEISSRKILDYVQKSKSRGSLLREYSDDQDIVPSRFTYLVSAVFSFDSTACIYLYAIGPLYALEKFGVSEGNVSLIFSVASLFGTVLTFLVLSSKGRALQRKYVRSPYNIYLVLILCTLSVIGLLVPSFVVQSICIIMIHGTIECFLTWISELQGAITTAHKYATLGPASQVGRKILGIVFAVSAPPLYSCQALLPYILSGSLCLLYTVLFIFFTQKQHRENSNVIASAIAAAHADMDVKDAKDLVREKSIGISVASWECYARLSDAALNTLTAAPATEGDGRGKTKDDYGMQILKEEDEDDDKDAGPVFSC